MGTLQKHLRIRTSPTAQPRVGWRAPGWIRDA
jgi:hypothetical protein